MISYLDIKENMEVVCSDGLHVGNVDHMEGASRIKITSEDLEEGRHHLIPMDWVDHVDDQIHLNKPCKDVRAQWQTSW